MCGSEVVLPPFALFSSKKKKQQCSFGFGVFTTQYSFVCLLSRLLSECPPLDLNITCIKAIGAILAAQVFQAHEAFWLNVFVLWKKIKDPSGREEATSRLPHRIHNLATYLVLNRFTLVVVSLSLEEDRLFKALIM